MSNDGRWSPYNVVLWNCCIAKRGLSPYPDEQAVEKGGGLIAFYASKAASLVDLEFRVYGISGLAQIRIYLEIICKNDGLTDIDRS